MISQLHNKVFKVFKRIIIHHYIWTLAIKEVMKCSDTRLGICKDGMTYKQTYFNPMILAFPDLAFPDLKIHTY